MVKDKRTNNFLPSCSALVQEGMDIDISGEDVRAMRKQAIELLLSEHRAECEAPCRIVCPAGYNIPLMHRYLQKNDLDAAIGLINSEIKDTEIHCTVCAGYFENACRRKKIDEPVSIKQIKLFIAAEIRKTRNLSAEPETEKKKKASAPFSSKTGKLEESELREWLKECGDTVRHREIPERNSAFEESRSCMHCDCRASADCRLRELATTFAIKDKGEKVVNAPVQKKINRNTGLIFENAKCIKCGLCVRTCGDFLNEPALCFINRGFVSIISEPLFSDFDDVLKNNADKVVSVCPTGALSRIP
jgi:ferredoxin